MAASKQTSPGSRQNSHTPSRQQQALHHETPKPWLRRPKESAKDYERFLAYRDLPPATRNFEQAYFAWTAAQAELTGATHHTAKRPPSSWYKIAKESDWRARALAWDDYRQELERIADEAEAEAVRRKRRDIVGRQLDAIDDALTRMDLQEMTATELRRYLADFYNALAKLLTASRAEMGEATEITKNQTQISGTVTVTSDDMARAIRELQDQGFPVIQEPVST
jgi:hypothetical protein